MSCDSRFSQKMALNVISVFPATFLIHKSVIQSKIKNKTSIKTYHVNVLITIIVTVKLWRKNVQRLEQSSTLLTLQAEDRIQCMFQQNEREKIGLFYHAFSSPSTHSGEKTFSHKICLNHFNC